MKAIHVFSVCCALAFVGAISATAAARLTGDLAALPPFDWSTADEVRPGVRLVDFKLQKPRLMRAWCLRCDLKGHRFGFEATHRSKDYGRKFACGKRQLTEHTQRVPTRDWIREHPEIVVAVNASPWDGEVRTLKRGEMPADVNGFSMSYGAVLSDYAIWTNVNFVIRRDGTPDILCSGKKALPAADRGKLLHAFMGYGIVLKEGRAIAPHCGALAPRTAYGLSRDRRYLYLLVVDGRQDAWSQGADMADLARMLKLLGAADGINMDGGGSSALLVRDPKTGRVKQYNRHDPLGLYARPVALNFGLSEKPAEPRSR